jgi:hypothetical protein
VAAVPLTVVSLTAVHAAGDETQYEDYEEARPDGFVTSYSRHGAFLQSTDSMGVCWYERDHSSIC